MQEECNLVRVILHIIIFTVEVLKPTWYSYDLWLVADMLTFCRVTFYKHSSDILN